MPDVELAGQQPRTEPVAVGPGETGEVAAASVAPDGAAEAPGEPEDGAADAALPARAMAGADASLLALVDQLTAVLERSDLGELEVAAGGTTIVLRAPIAVERPAGPAIVHDPAVVDVDNVPAAPAAPATAAPDVAPVLRPAVKAPLTGIFYAAPSPGAMPYVAVGDHVSTGQIIGLIEAMKLFNEIKSDLAGRVVRICAESGALVKAKQALIEVEPA